MPGGITLKESNPADIPTPAPGKDTIFIDSTAIPPTPSYKNDSGAVITLKGSSGITGAQGPIGPVMFISDGLDGEPGFPGPPGIQGLPGSGSSDWDATITKTVDDTVTNSATLTNDSELVTAALVTNGIYHVEFMILYSGDSAAADYQCQFALSTGSMDGIGFQLYRGTTLSASLQTLLSGTNIYPNGSISAGTDSGGAGQIFTIWGRLFFIILTGTPTLQFKFAQNVITAAKSVKTRAKSYMKIKKIGP